MTANSPEPEEYAIIRAVLAGHTDRFQELVRLHQNAIYSLLMRQIGDGMVAKDLSQDTFMRAYRYLAKFRYESSFRTWIVRIALNVANSYFSSRQYKARLVTVNAEQALLSQASDPSEDKLHFERLLDTVQGQIGTLKPIYREILVLFYFENQNYQEIAEILKIPMGTVASRLNKAIHLLRREFGGK